MKIVKLSLILIAIGLIAFGLFTINYEQFLDMENAPSFVALLCGFSALAMMLLIKNAQAIGERIEK